MAEHMTAEQMRAELLILADRLSNLALPDEDDDPGTLDEASDIEYGMRKIATRLSGMAFLPTNRVYPLTGGDITSMGASLTHELWLPVETAEACVRQVVRLVAPALLAAAPEPPHG